ncbi:MAG: hypothetical protein OMM_04880 [Candidatus Magnetoglobus multicellularis str. Araruama]|uniref:Phosphodiester glycosidase domain-containing protein n=1 Tax=Candidatus Magnetoglobus multicellularis str. Araruama TaxID=890399 RepID=A0A1V1NZA6_9BACT|nr:MAG: hypothetical protein OMM_04880 [Candidatus Magnetoglobus multicellularis str. Araruama]
MLNYLKQFDSIKDYLPNKQTRMSLKFYHQYAPTISGKSAVSIYEIYDNQQIIGYSIWLKRPELKANYFAFQTNTKSVYQRYQHWVSSQNRRVVLVTTGGFTNRRRQPEGLTVEKGRIVNAVTLPERHGLVIVSKGGLRVLNLKRNAFTLPLSSNNTTRAINPLNSLMDFSALIKWSIKNDATLFQTQLLAYSDQLLIDKSKARINPRERRILALVRDQNNCVHHIIFHIERNYNLADIADNIFQLLKTRVKKIEAILNLDVGSYNILHVYDENRNQLKDITGPVHINNATNLIVYTK